MPDLSPPFVPGWDLAGTVSEAGAEVSAYAAGDAVVALIPWIHERGRAGAYAEVAAVDRSWLAPRPQELDPVSAATIPLNALTARQTLDLLRAPPGATLLVTGASGAVGGFATQLAVLDGLRVLALASNEDDDWVDGLGPAEVLPRGTDLRAVGPVDALIDAVPLGERAVAAVRDGGAAVLTRRLRDVAQGRDVRVEAPLARSDPTMLEELTRLVASGELRTRVARTLELEQAAEAHRLVERGGLRGKVVLES
jgi:NADPH:quinone reductase-like Zn-dependent oxidoreductase